MDYIVEIQINVRNELLNFTGISADQLMSHILFLNHLLSVLVDQIQVVILLREDDLLNLGEESNDLLHLLNIALMELLDLVYDFALLNVALLLHFE